MRKVLMLNGNNPKVRNTYYVLGQKPRNMKFEHKVFKQINEITGVSLITFSNVLNPDYLPAVLLNIKGRPLEYHNDDGDYNVKLSNDIGKKSLDVDGHVLDTAMLYRLDETQLIGAIRGGLADVGSGFVLRLQKALEGKRFERETSVSISSLKTRDDSLIQMITDLDPARVNDDLLRGGMDQADNPAYTSLQEVIDVALDQVSSVRESEINLSAGKGDSHVVRSVVLSRNAEELDLGDVSGEDKDKVALGEKSLVTPDTSHTDDGDDLDTDEKRALGILDGEDDDDTEVADDGVNESEDAVTVSEDEPAIDGESYNQDIIKNKSDSIIGSEAMAIIERDEQSEYKRKLGDKKKEQDAVNTMASSSKNLAKVKHRISRDLSDDGPEM
jgi:hypothetical protein